MAKIILNIAKAYDDGFIEKIENTKYFQLHKNATTRADLYCFAIALCEMEEKEPSSIQSVGSTKSFVRAESMINYEPLLSSLFYSKELKNKPDCIDEICNRDDVYILAEQYANTGFGILEEYTKTMDEETLLYKLISYMNKKYDSIKDELENLM